MTSSCKRKRFLFSLPPSSSSFSVGAFSLSLACFKLEQKAFNKHPVLIKEGHLLTVYAHSEEIQLSSYVQWENRKTRHS